jgi:hypothetical protein
VNSVSDRQSFHERNSTKMIGRYIPLEVYFKATGSIAYKERHIRRLTEEYMLDGHNRNSEWRKCHPRKLISDLKDEACKRGWGYEVEFSRFGS